MSVTLVPKIPRRDPKREDKWAVWNIKAAPCCGRKFVSVFHASLLEIECDCGAWIATPTYMRLLKRQEREASA